MSSATTACTSVQSGQELDSLLSAMAAGVVQVDLGGRVGYANAAALRILGITAEQLIGRTLAEAGFAAYEESGAPLRPEQSPLMQLGEGGGASHAPVRYVRQPALDVWIESHSAPLRSAAGALLGSVATFVDVTERVRRQAAERVRTGRMNDVLRLMAAGVLFVDAEGRIEYANPAAAALSGLTPEQVIGQLAADPAWQLTDDTGAVQAYDALPVPTALRERREVRDVELGFPTLSGVMKWMRVSAVPIDFQIIRAVNPSRAPDFQI